MSLSYEEVAQIIKMIDNSNCDEVNIEIDGIKILVRKNAANHVQTNDKKTISTPDSNIKNIETKDENKLEKSKIHDTSNYIKSPMVGTFYSKPSPDEKPFVNEGDNIKIGDVVGLIDVMKLFTNIESSLNGRIKSILVNDGDLVEFDQPIIEIEIS